MKILKVIVSGIMIICLVIFYFTNPPRFTRLYHRKFYEMEYYGIVRERFIDVANHESRVIKIQKMDVTETSNVKICTPLGNEDIYPFLQQGDTILKKGDSNEIIIRGEQIDTTIVYYLKYP
ncbi:hypothetical protein EYV94_27575 [Puteibacter caeruleilacunae]|nr:hypothetical protein EYV94_27575 [Puteibacter caeruleilacunae]